MAMVRPEVDLRRKVFVYDEVGRCIGIVRLEIGEADEKDGDRIWKQICAKQPDLSDRGESFMIETS